MLWRPTAPKELSEAYAIAAGMATKRAAECVVSGRAKEAPLWTNLATYCAGMAESGALDDDQFQFQRNRQRHRKEVPMTEDDMDAAGLFIVGVTRQLPEWQWAAYELAMGYLSPLQRVCFEMKVAGGLTYGDIAEALNMTKNEVQTHVKRAQQTFEQKVRPLLNHIFDEHQQG